MTLAALSQSIARVVESTAPLIAAIRVGPNRHITGLVCDGGMVVTTDQILPALEGFTVVLANGTLTAARPGLRNPASNLAILHIDTPCSVANPEITAIRVGSIAVILAADADASPMVRLTVVHRLIRTADGPAPVLDLSSERIEPGSLVLDANGRLVGMLALGPNTEGLVIAGGAIGRVFASNPHPAKSYPAQARIAPLHSGSSLPVPVAPLVSNRRGWLGVALQPITVPDALMARAGQGSGRMVVTLTKGGPAELAGLRVGDVLLALNGTSASGPQALRAFLGPERVGSAVEIKLLRDGNVLTTHLTVAAQPD